MRKITSSLLLLALVACSGLSNSTPAPSVKTAEHPMNVSDQYYGCGRQSPFNLESYLTGPSGESAAYIYAFDNSAAQPQPVSGPGIAGASLGITINVVNNSTPEVTVSPGESDHVPKTPTYYDSSLYIETGSDHHYINLNQITCNEDEYYDTVAGSGGLTADTGYEDSITSGGYVGPQWSNDGPGGSTASGLPLGQLALTPSDISGSGVIQHTLGMNVVAQTIDEKYVYPADQDGGLAYIPPTGGCSLPICAPMPYGSVWCLNPNAVTGTLTPLAQRIATALETYCAFTYDTGDENIILDACDNSGPGGAQVCPVIDPTTLKQVQSWILNSTYWYINNPPVGPNVRVRKHRGKN